MLPLLTALWIGLLATVCDALRVTSATTTFLGVDPEGAQILNGESFQQSAITTFNGWQYVAFYNSSGTYLQNYVSVGRRQLVPSVGAWQIVVLKDYVQKTEDGHDTISIGVAPGDGTIHLSFDHHDVPLNYRVSQQGVTTNPSGVTWSTSLFGPTIHNLPGAVPGNFTPLTYPRFEPVGQDLLMEYRIGESGAGDSYIFLYSTSSHSWKETGRYIAGTNNNAYINGMQYVSSLGTLQTSWTWRETPDVVTNHDLGYAISHDLGHTWLNSAGQQIGSVSGTPILPSSPGSLVFTIPQNSGILNQEGQYASTDGGFHVLNRETTSGQYLWYHYYRTPAGAWSRNPIATPTALVNNPMPTGPRGKLAVKQPTGELIAIILSNQADATLYVLQSTPAGAFKDWTVLWQGAGYALDPLWDFQRLNLPASQGGGVLSIFIRQTGGFPVRKVGVLDLVLQ